jgi:hypothetical protein
VDSLYVSTKIWIKGLEKKAKLAQSQSYDIGGASVLLSSRTLSTKNVSEKTEASGFEQHQLAAQMGGNVEKQALDVFEK